MIVELENERIKMSISTLGAEPQSLKMEGREYLWNGDKEFWFRRAPLLFPSIGPTERDLIWHERKEYRMSNNGFARDTEFDLVETDGKSAVFRLEDSRKTREENYPFGFSLTVTYTLLDNGYEAKCTIYAKDDLYYQFGWHPAFSLLINGEDCELENYFVTFSEEEDLVRKYADNGIFKYEAGFVRGKRLDLKRSETDKGAIILDDVKSRSVTLCSAKGPHTVSATLGDMNTLTIWTVSGKKGAYVCLEPMTSFGDVKREKEVSLAKENRKLEKGESITYANSFTIS